MNKISFVTFINFIILLFFASAHAYANPKTQIAIFAGGCFWCMEADFEQLQKENDGILSVVAGYDGGNIQNPTYELVSSGKTNYVESVMIKYNPEKIKYITLVKYFFLHIDPTVKDRQFCDIGKEYKSAIFYVNQYQQKIAKLILNEAAHKLQKPIYTDILPSTKFYEAENYHQNYAAKNPLRYKFYRWNCERDQTLEKVWGNQTI